MPAEFLPATGVVNFDMANNVISGSASDVAKQADARHSTAKLSICSQNEPNIILSVPEFPSVSGWENLSDRSWCYDQSSVNMIFIGQDKGNNQFQLK